jgi:kinesin family protein 4/21/27
MGAFVEGDEDEGIIPRAARHMFDILDSKTLQGAGKIVASLHVSFIEIYNDECRDLLHPDIQPRDICIREDKEGRIFFTGAREEGVGSAEDLLRLLDQGNRSRTTAETFMNATSSRSHVRIFI